MPRRKFTAAIAFALLTSVLAHADEDEIDAMTREDEELVGVGTASAPAGYVNMKSPWIDRAHDGVFNAVWRSAARMEDGGGSLGLALGLSLARGITTVGVASDSSGGAMSGGGRSVLRAGASERSAASESSVSISRCLYTEPETEPPPMPAAVRLGD